MSLYLDTSVFVALLTDDIFTERADRYFRQNPQTAIISNLGTVEYASVLARRVRMGRITTSQARSSFSALDGWSLRSARRVELDPTDIAMAEHWLRRLDLPLRTLDAMHIAIAQRLSATLVAFDQRMVASAQALGAAVMMP